MSGFQPTRLWSVVGSFQLLYCTKLYFLAHKICSVCNLDSITLDFVDRIIAIGFIEKKKDKIMQKKMIFLCDS